LTLGTGELLEGFEKNLFVEKDPGWWVNAAYLLIENHYNINDLYKRPFWLSDDLRLLPCQKSTDTSIPLVFGDAISSFSARWNLLDRLHPEYGTSEFSDQIIGWLDKNAAFKTSVNAAIELAAFAEKFSTMPFAVDDVSLREIRDRFDEMLDQDIGDLGQRVGKAILLDGYVYKAGKSQKMKVFPSEAYLCKTLEGDNPNWPVAARNIPGIQWIGARYEEQLKTGATRMRRRREDGRVSRGPRKFLMLLGVECTPRILRTGSAKWGSPTRVKELKERGAELVPYDLVSPDMELVLLALNRMPKKDAKLQSPALLRALSRNWERVYRSNKFVPSQHEARVYLYNKEHVTSSWLLALKETKWIFVGKGNLVLPSEAVIRSSETETLYPASSFVFGIDQNTEISKEFAETLSLITEVRVSHLILHLMQIRDSDENIQCKDVLPIYRDIAKHCPKKFHLEH